MINSDVVIMEIHDGLLVKCKDIFGKESSMFLPTNTETFTKYLTGDYHVQDLFPMFSADQREFLITGLSPDDFNRIIPED